MTMRHLSTALLGLFLVAVIAGCGKKGPLELPPGATPSPAATSASTGAEDPDNAHVVPIEMRTSDDGMTIERSTRGNND